MQLSTIISQIIQHAIHVTKKHLFKLILAFFLLGGVFSSNLRAARPYSNQSRDWWSNSKTEIRKNVYRKGFLWAITMLTIALGLVYYFLPLQEFTIITGVVALFFFELKSKVELLKKCFICAI